MLVLHAATARAKIIPADLLRTLAMHDPPFQFQSRGTGNVKINIARVAERGKVGA